MILEVAHFGDGEIKDTTVSVCGCDGVKEEVMVFEVNRFRDERDHGDSPHLQIRKQIDAAQRS